MNKETRTYNEYEIDCDIMGEPMIFDHWAKANEQVQICRKRGHNIKLRARNVIETIQTTNWEGISDHFPVAEESNDNPS